MDANQNLSTPSKIIKIKSGLQIDINATKFSGILERVKHNGNNGWKVLQIGGVDCTGVIYEPKIGGYYELEGSFSEKKKYNSWSFEFKSYSEKIEAGKGLIEYLAREAPGLGYALAGKLVTHFKNETMRVLEEKPGQVRYLLGTSISEQKAKELSDWAKAQRYNSKLKESLYNIGITPSQVGKLIKHYGANAKDKIMKDCFSLTEVHGFGFKTVSAIADLIGVPKTDKGRIKAAILHAIKTVCEDGHTCAKKSDLLRECCALLDLSQQHVDPVINEMIEEDQLFTSDTDFEKLCQTQGIIL